MARPLSLLDFALAYARAGFAVFPCRPRGKEPITKHGFKDAACDEAQIRKWWMDSPNANVGIAAGARSGLIIVDIDSLAGAKLLAELAAQFGTLPPTHHDTTGKGHQFFFKLPFDCGTVPSSAEGGLDIRADGGYVVAPPSIHPNGKTYQWDARSPNEMALAPVWLLDFARDRDAVLKALDGPAAAKDVSGGPAGDGHPAPRQGRANDGPRAFDEFAPARAPEPWSEIGEQRLRSALAAIPADNRDIWLKVGFALHDLAAHDPRWQGREMWDAWSKTCPEKFNEADQQRTWASFDRDYHGPRVTVATIYHLAQEFGWRDPTAPTADCHASDRKELPKLGAGDSVEGGIGERLSEPQATFARLAALSPIEYDRVRIAEAEKLGVRVGTLDDGVEKFRLPGDAAGMAGRALSLPAPEPWTEPVDGAALLEAIVETITRYVALSPAAAVAVALWCIHAHAFEAFYISPRLSITSPEKRCGKSTLLRVMQPMLPKALCAANITVAAMFRTVEACRPALLIDEADSFLKDNEELRGMINSGHACDGTAIRLVGEDHEPRVFSTWCPVAIAAIGALPGTIEDRSVIIQMRRRHPDERVARFRIDRVGAQHELGRKAARWAADSARALRDADPAVPTELNDRAADNWRPASCDRRSSGQSVARKGASRRA